MSSDTPVVDGWKRRIAEYERIIQKFERLGSDLRSRRKGASDNVMTVIDERLKLNDRTLKSMRVGMKTALNEIKRLVKKDSK